MHPQVIDGKYEVIRELSKGGMGAVYEARHCLTDRRVALKLILADALRGDRAPDALRRFEREARACGAIDSRHVVAILDTGVEVSTKDHYIVMELLTGADLRQLLREKRTLVPALVSKIAFQTCSGLRRAHERGIVHRDVKAANIFLARRDDGQVEVKLLDFGIAKLRADPLASSDAHDLTRSGSVLGSPAYMSPEQATGSRTVDARSDLWSLGVVMYEALSGTTPHGEKALGALILAICSEPARPLRERAPWVSDELAAVVHKALALEPSQRFASADEMQAALAALLPEGAALDEATLGRAFETGGESRPTPDESVPPILTAQTTVDAVTFGSGSKSRPSELPGRRAPVRRAILAGAAVALVGASGWAFVARTRTSPALENDRAADGISGEAATTASSRAAAPPADLAVQTSPADHETTMAPSVPSAKPPTRRPVAAKGRAAAAPSHAPRVAASASSSPSEGSDSTPRSRSSTPAQPIEPDDSLIDRRFD